MKENIEQGLYFCESINQLQLPRALCCNYLFGLFNRSKLFAPEGMKNLQSLMSVNLHRYHIAIRKWTDMELSASDGTKKNNNKREKERAGYSNRKAGQLYNKSGRG